MSRDRPRDEASGCQSVQPAFHTPMPRPDDSGESSDSLSLICTTGCSSPSDGLYIKLHGMFAKVFAHDLVHSEHSIATRLPHSPANTDSCPGVPGWTGWSLSSKTFPGKATAPTGLSQPIRSTRRPCRAFPPPPGPGAKAPDHIAAGTQANRQTKALKPARGVFGGSEVGAGPREEAGSCTGAIPHVTQVRARAVPRRRHWRQICWT